MQINQFCKSLLFLMLISTNLLNFSFEAANAYPVFAQQNYTNPRAANGKLACANCHLNQKAIEVKAPQAVLPNSIFTVQIEIPYDRTQQQIGTNGKKTDLNVGGILILPKGFKLAPKNKISKEIKQKNKGVFISPYSTESDNILVVGPISGKQHQELIFPITTPDPQNDNNIKYLTYPVYAGGNRGRGQVYPTGEKSNINTFSSLESGQIIEIQKTEKGESNILILNSQGNKISQILPPGLELLVKSGETIKINQPLNQDPNVGGFGQEETEILLQNPLRIVGYIIFCFIALLTQVLLILKKKQFEKVQAAELNF